MTQAILLIAALALFFFGSLSYVRDTFAGRSKPNRMTMLIWALGPFIACAAALSDGGSWALLPVFMGGLGPFLIFLASFTNSQAYWRLGVLSYVCGIVAMLALVLWRLTADPAVAVLFSILADGLAAFPTIVKAWRHPETETRIAYVFANLNALLGLLFSVDRSFTQTGFLWYLFICNGILIIALYRPALPHRRV